MADFKTGTIWKNSASRRAQIVRRVCESLELEYGRPRLGNPRDPIDDLVYIILSNKTTPTKSHTIYSELKKSYPQWSQFLEAPIADVRMILRSGGLGRVKSLQIRNALRKILKDFGEIRLHRLRNWSQCDAENYLTTLPGVSEKVAKCVMIYTLGFDVLPVDGHVHRIASRLNWTARKRADQCHLELESLVKPKDRFAFHVACICHGRVVCTPSNPLCDQCVVRKHCSFGRIHE